MLRVVNIIEEANLGGPQIRIALVAKKLINEGIHTVVLFPRQESNNFVSLLEKNKINYKQLSISRLSKNYKSIFKYIIYSVFEIYNISKFIKSNNFDIAHISGGSWQFKGIIGAKLAGVKSIWYLNDTYVPFIFRKSFYFLNRLSDGFMYASKRTEKYYKPLIAKNKYEFLVPPPVDTSKFDPFKKFEISDKINNRFNNKLIIGTVSNINPVKGLETFIRSSALLNQKYDNIYFIIIGAIIKSQKKYYQSLIALANSKNIKNIFFFSKEKDVRYLLNKFDIFVCSSNFEAGTMTVREAMSFSKPIISTDVGDVSTFITNNYNGFVVPKKDSNQMANKISHLLDDKEKRKIFGRRNRKIAKSKFDISICVEQHKNAYFTINNRLNNNDKRNIKVN